MTTKLTDSQKQTIRKALAEWMGLKSTKDICPDCHGTGECGGGNDPDYYPCEHCEGGKVAPYYVGPDYCASLDSCHEIIRNLYVGLPTLNDNLKSFRDQLAKIKGVAWYQSAVLLSANAEEVSLAIYRALNLGELGD